MPSHAMDHQSSRNSGINCINNLIKMQNAKGAAVAGVLISQQARRQQPALVVQRCNIVEVDLGVSILIILISDMVDKNIWWRMMTRCLQRIMQCWSLLRVPFLYFLCKGVREPSWIWDPDPFSLSCNQKLRKQRRINDQLLNGRFGKGYNAPELII